MSAVASDGDPSKPSEELPGSPDHRAAAAAGHEPGELGEAAEAAVAAGPKRPAKGTSRLGLLAMFAGIGACVLCRPSMLPPSLPLNPTTPAVAGLVLAFLALVGRLFGSRAKAGLPLLAVLLCLTAIGISAYQGGARDLDSTRRWANGQVEKYRTALNQLQKRVAPANPPANATNPAIAGQSSPGPSSPQAVPGAVGQSGTPASPGSAIVPSNPNVGVGAGTIFDMRPGAPGSSTGGTGGSPPEGGAPPAGSVPPAPMPLEPGPGASVPPSAAGPAHGASVSPRVLSAQAALRAAQGKEKAAEDDFRYSYAKTNDPQYLAAQAEVNAADKLVEDAKQRSDGFGQPLIDATRQRKEAQEKVARIVNDAMARDPAVAASRRDLAAAEESLRQANDAAAR